MMQWHYSKDGHQQGPVSAEQLKQLASSGQLQPTDLVWKEGMAQWAEAGRVKGLFPVAAVATSCPPPIPATSSPPSPAKPSTNVAAGDVPALWQPWSIGFWSIPFSWAFGAILVAKNWNALGDSSRAKRAMLWFYPIFPWLVLCRMAPSIEVIQLVLLLGPVAILVAFVLLEVQPQAKLVKERLNNQFPRKPWVIPLGIGMACFVAFIAICSTSATPESVSAKAPAVQASTVMPPASANATSEPVQPSYSSTVKPPSANATSQPVQPSYLSTADNGSGKAAEATNGAASSHIAWVSMADGPIPLKKALEQMVIVKPLTPDGGMDPTATSWNCLVGGGFRVTCGTTSCCSPDPTQTIYVSLAHTPDGMVVLIQFWTDYAPGHMPPEKNHYAMRSMLGNLGSVFSGTPGWDFTRFRKLVFGDSARLVTTGVHENIGKASANAILADGKLIFTVAIDPEQTAGGLSSEMLHTVLNQELRFNRMSP
jgi:hypothetical protein